MRVTTFAATRPQHAATRIGAAIQDTRVVTAILVYAVAQELFAAI
jgi:hypothetical protein